MVDRLQGPSEAPGIWRLDDLVRYARAKVPCAGGYLCRALGPFRTAEVKLMPMGVPEK